VTFSLSKVSLLKILARFFFKLFFFTFLDRGTYDSEVFSESLHDIIMMSESGNIWVTSRCGIQQLLRFDSMLHSDRQGETCCHFVGLFCSMYTGNFYAVDALVSRNVFKRETFLWGNNA